MPAHVHAEGAVPASAIPAPWSAMPQRMALHGAEEEPSDDLCVRPSCCCGRAIPAIYTPPQEKLKRPSEEQQEGYIIARWDLIEHVLSSPLLWRCAGSSKGRCARMDRSLPQTADGPLLTGRV